MSKKIFSLPIVLLFLPLVLVLIGGCVAPTQAWLDAKVDRLCAKDGGVKIYEKIYLPPEQFDKYGVVKFFNMNDSKNLRYNESAFGPDYLVKDTQEYLHGDASTDDVFKPVLIQYHFQLYRRSDGKLLGEAIEYERIGGDPFLLRELGSGMPSSYRCPHTYRGVFLVRNGVFIEMRGGGENERK